MDVRRDKRVALIACVKMKLPNKAKAEYLYTSPLFKGNLQFAKTLNPDEILILSAKYGLVELYDEIEPYDVTLKNMKVKAISNSFFGTVERQSASVELMIRFLSMTTLGIANTQS